jgi:hypothetical protein
VRFVWAGALAVFVAGCGSSSTHAYSHVSVRLAVGFRYAAGLTVNGGRQCLLESLELIGARVVPFERTMRSCGAVAAIKPRLVQSSRPAVRVILDQPGSSCGSVRVGNGGVVPSTCSETEPKLRVTVVPGGGALSVRGIAGISSVPAPSRACRPVCERPLG